MRSAMAGQPQQSGKSPLDQERQRGPTQPEQTPEAPKPSPGEKQPGQAQPQPTKADDRTKNPPPGENHPAPPRTDPSAPPVTPGNDSERWGMLPERVRAVFQNQITDDLPLQYRDWIDSYYRRLNGTRP